MRVLGHRLRAVKHYFFDLNAAISLRPFIVLNNIPIHVYYFLDVTFNLLIKAQNVSVHLTHWPILITLTQNVSLGPFHLTNAAFDLKRSFVFFPFPKCF